MKKLTIPLFALIVFASCRNEVKQIAQEQTTPIDTLKFQYADTVAVSKHIVQGDLNDFTDTTTASISYPKFEEQWLNDSIARQVFNYFSPEEKVTNYGHIVKSFINGFDQSFKENPKMVHGWELDIHIEVVYQNANYLSLAYTHSDYTGGAHPNTTTSYLNFDLANKKSLTLGDLIAKGKQKELAILAEKLFREQEKLSADAPLDKDYFFEGGKFSLPRNFSINQRGLNFYYNRYEIKPYVAGPTTLLIPFEQLKDIAKPNSIINIH